MNYNKKSVEDIDVAGKRVLCRCDFNVPTKDGKITSDKRIVAALPTIQYLVKHNARVILCSHMGKPKGEVKPELSLQVVADRLSELLGQPVKMAKDVVGESAQALAASLKDGEVMLLENTRFEKGETKNDPELSKKLASMADIFVNDAFGTAHRAHASTAGVADYLPAVCGYLVQKEVSIMGKALADPERPFVAILGGAKVSDKLNVINNLLEKVDTLIIGGGMAYTFVAAKGYGIVTPTIDELHLEEPEIVRQGSRYGVRLKASAPSIHMIRADIETEVSPIVGSEKQSEELVKYLLDEFEENPRKIWESNFFGKTLHELVNEGLITKLNRTPEDARCKLQETLQRIINEGSGGLICIIL